MQNNLSAAFVANATVMFPHLFLSNTNKYSLD